MKWSDSFRHYMTRVVGTSQSQALKFIDWIYDYAKFRKRAIESGIAAEDPEALLDAYKTDLARRADSLAVVEAVDAVKYFRYWRSRESDPSETHPQHTTRSYVPGLLAETRRILRLRQVSYRTEQTYIRWIERFLEQARARSADALEESHIKRFLTYIAVERKVSKATQQQAFNAILFLYRMVLGVQVVSVRDTVRAAPKQKLPVVLTRNELREIFNHLDGRFRLMARLMYGGGLRLRECLALRVQDLDFDGEALIVRSGKGDKDRVTLFPPALHGEVRHHQQARGKEPA